MKSFQPAFNWAYRLRIFLSRGAGASSSNGSFSSAILRDLEPPQMNVLKSELSIDEMV